MIARALFGLAALVPVAFGTGPAAAGAITLQLCSATGSVKTITVRLNSSAPGPEDDTAPSCAKACHAGGSRKRGGCEI